MNRCEMVPVPTRELRKIGSLVELVKRMPSGDPRYALFLGAGASLSSGVPTCDQLVTQWKRRLFLSEKGLHKWQPHLAPGFDSWLAKSYGKWCDEWEAAYGRQPSEYSLLFSYAYPDLEARQGFVERLCTGCEPGPGYIYLASLVLAGQFQTFLTTNFDDLLHDALFRYAGVKPIVCAFDSQVSSVRMQSPRPKIIKLHGDFLFTNIKNTGSELGRLDVNMEAKFQRTCENYGLIVIGYGGNDQSVMGPLRAMLHRQDCLGHGIHWCIFNEPSDEAVDRDDEKTLVPSDLHRIWESYRDKVHIYSVGSFDSVMESLYRGCRCLPPPELAAPQQKALYQRLRDGIENADQTWRLSSTFSQLLAGFREAASMPPPKNPMLLDQADQLHRSGLAMMKKGDLEAAGADFQAAAALASEVISNGSTGLEEVRALRRRSGARTSLAEIIIKKSSPRPDRSASIELPADRIAEFRQMISGALMDVRKGLAVDQGVGGPPELRGHRLNLWFNGLCAFALINLVDPEGLCDGAGEALAWLEEVTNEDNFSDEIIGFLADEVGGERLLSQLETISNDQDSSA
jgi:NAD-dependent SIR2 family protein deacetylase